MSKHVLLENAFRYTDPKVNPIPENWTYNKSSGYWVKNETAEAMMLSANPNCSQTRKADVETGEDQKGE
jgi:hypothetical protein